MISSTILSEIVTDQCIHLCAKVLSQYDFTDLAHPMHEYWCPFEHYSIRFKEIFAKELVELAALARVSLDIDDSFGSTKIVGSLTKGNEPIDLSFREACNKIIHAKTIEVDFAFSCEHPLDNGKNGYSESQVKQFKNPSIKTTGTFRNNDWQSDICFLKYVEVLHGKFT